MGNDEGQLSVYDGNQISAPDSWKHYTDKLNRPSIGVISVTKKECIDEGLVVNPDPKPFSEHVLIDFTHFGRTKQKRKAKLLRDVAWERGWQYGPILEPESSLA